MAEIAIAGATAVLRQAAVVLGNLVVQEGPRLFRLTEDMEWIENEMRYIQAYLDDVEDKQWKSRGVTNLVRNILDISCDVQDIIDTYFPKLASRGNSYKRKGGVGWFKSAACLPNHYKIVRDFAVEIEGVKRRIEDIDRVRRVYGIQEKSGYDEEETWDPTQSFPHVDEDPIGLEKHVEDLVHKVRSQPVVSIIGMAGLGKTTLAKKVYNTVTQEFPSTAWISVSQRPNVLELLRNIARQVGLEEDKMKTNLVHNLYEFLCQKRYVIFIDDIWQPETWDDLKIGIPNNPMRRIVLTSRNKDVGMHVGEEVQVGEEDSLYKLEPLDPKNSKKLFFKIIRAAPQSLIEASNPLPSRFEAISKEILERCRGVPLAIVLTASMLRLKGKTLHSWKGVLESMGQEEDKYSKIFFLSYKDLPSKLKPCFLYCGLFPEDYEIHVSDLINLWTAEGFIRGSGVRQVEEVGEDHLDELIARNLIQVDRRRSDGRIKTCRIHDILHDLCVRVAKDINFFNTGNDIAVGNSGIKVRRVTIPDQFGYSSVNFKTPRLRSMLSFETRRDAVPENFFEDLRLLRVLRLSHPFGKIGHLSMLTYVQLRLESDSKLTSSISNLKNLQTLDLRESYCITIPICIWKMKQLRHLLLGLWSVIEMDLRGWMLNKMGGKYFHHPIGAYSNTNLQTLYRLYIPGSSPRHWFPKLTSLRKLGVTFAGGDLTNVKALLDSVTTASTKLEILRLENEYVSASYNIEDLKLCSSKNLFRMHLVGSVVDLTDKVLPPNLTKLTLEYTRLAKDPMETLKKLPNLKILKLLEDASPEGVNSGGRNDAPTQQVNHPVLPSGLGQEGSAQDRRAYHHQLKA